MGLIIKALRDGFRRAGIAHTQAGAFYPDDTFTEEQLLALKAEPQLVVIEGVEEPEEEGGDENEDGGLEGDGAQTGSPSGASKSAATGDKTRRVRGS
jgi:hypothetical protein